MNGSKKNKLNTFDIFCIGVNAIIGSGIFLFPAIIAKQAGSISIFAFLICGILLISIALCYAELGSMFKRNGGSYVYAKEAYGPVIGFGVGWMAWVTSVFSWAAVANAVSSYLGYFNPSFSEPVIVKVVACGIILTFGLINYRGIKLGAWTVNFFTIAKILPLSIFIIFGLIYIAGRPFALSFNETGSLSTFGYAIFLSLWPLQGFETTPVAAGEAQNPKKAVPVAAIGSLLFTTFMYTLIQIVVVGVYADLPPDTKKPLADAAIIFMGVMGGTLIAVGALISMTGYNAGNALGSPRYLSALAEDKFIPQLFSKIHPTFNTPSNAIFFTTLATFVAALFLNFESLVDISNLAVIIQYLSTCTAVLFLRHKKPDMKRGFKIPLGNAVSFIGCIISIWLIQQVKINELIFSGIVLIIGFVIMWIYKKHKK